MQQLADLAFEDSQAAGVTGPALSSINMQELQMDEIARMP